MAAKLRFIDDTQPRKFPSEKKQSGWRKTPDLVPRPSLPGLSLMVDKKQAAKAVPKKSFLKWKQQHEALFEPKHRGTNHVTGFVNQKKAVVPHHQAVVPHQQSPKFELDFHKLIPVQHHAEYQQFAFECDSNKNNFPAANGAKKREFQSMMTFSQLNRVARSRAVNCNVPLEGQLNADPIEDHQSNPCGCQCVAVTSNELDNTQETAPHLQAIASPMEKAVMPKGTLTLASIVKEQIEIVEQQKQILMQQNEIFKLQYQIEKLLLMNNGLKNASSVKQVQSSPICKTIATSPVKPNAVPTHNEASPTARKSIGVMTSFHGNGACCSPDRNPNVASYENGSPKDTMLERINKIIQNSPPIVNYKLNNGNKNFRVSPQRADINISSQTLIYKTSTTNSISINEPKMADRSFAFHLLDMKYNPETPTNSTANRCSPRSGSSEKTRRHASKSIANDFVPSNISPDKYDYLMRHGLLSE